MRKLRQGESKTMWRSFDGKGTREIRKQQGRGRSGQCSWVLPVFLFFKIGAITAYSYADGKQQKGRENDDAEQKEITFRSNT